MIGKCGGAISLVCTALLLAVPQAAAQEKKTLTISSWGGAFQKAQKEAWFGIVEKELNVVIKEDNTSGIADVRTQVASGKPTWDLTTQGAYSCALLEKEGRLEKFDAETMKALTDIPTTLGRSEHCAPQIVYSVAIGWRDKAYPGKVPDGLGSVLGHEELPRSTLRPQASHLCPRDGVDRRRRADGQALSARCRPRLQEARAAEAARARLVELGCAVRAGAEGRRGRHGGGVERPHPGARDRARGQRGQDQDHLQPANHRLRQLDDSEGRTQHGSSP